MVGLLSNDVLVSVLISGDVADDVIDDEVDNGVIVLGVVPKWGRESIKQCHQQSLTND